jgi:allantoinase
VIVGDMRGSTVRTAIAGGTVVFEEGAVPATIVVAADGTIEAVVGPAERVAVDEVIDATGLHVFPGAVDPHTHLNDPGSTDSEDFFSGTCGAAAGGVTTCIEMPQTIPIVTNRERFLEKQAIAREKAVVDFALWGAITAENVADGGGDLLELADSGAIAFKAFTSESPEQPRIADRLLAEAMSQVTGLGLLVGIHCEDQPLIDFFTARLKREGRNDALVGADSRPAIAEIEAARRVITLAELVGARIHLAHVSCPETIDLVTAAKARGVDVTAETCAHYLKLTREDLGRIGAYAMCNPPLRDEAAKEGMWERLAGGYIDCIGSDHCAYTEEEKANPDYWEMCAGISGMQVMVPLVIGEAALRGVDLSTIAGAFSGAPARRFGLYPRKGAILPGSDADLVLVDLGSSWDVRGAELFQKAPGTAYEGYSIPARVRRTLVRGRSVFAETPTGEGGILVEPGYGQFVRPTR